MLRNKFVSRNPQWDRLFIQNLTKLSLNAQKLEKLEKQLEQLRANMAQETEEAKTGDNKSDTTQAKSEASQPEWTKQVCEEHLRFVIFMRDSLGDQQLHTTKIDTSLIPTYSLQFLKPEQKNTIFKEAARKVRQHLQRQRPMLYKMEMRAIPQRIKTYFTYRIVTLSIQEEAKGDGLLMRTCQQILFQLFRPLLLEPNKNRSRFRAPGPSIHKAHTVPAGELFELD